MYDSSKFIFSNIVKPFIFIFVFLCVTALSSLSLNAQEEDPVKLGAETFKTKGCVACHTIGKGKLSGPDLLGVTQRREEEWLKKWLKSPDTMVMTDPIAKEMLKEHLVPMPNQNLSDEQIVYLIEYFKSEDSKNNKN